MRTSTADRRSALAPPGLLAAANAFAHNRARVGWKIFTPNALNPLKNLILKT
jgi:hypothetical protein